MGKRDIYGPDLNVHEQQAREIADTGMKCMKSTGATSSTESAKGKDASASELDHLLPKKE